MKEREKIDLVTLIIFISLVVLAVISAIVFFVTKDISIEELASAVSVIFTIGAVLVGLFGVLASTSRIATGEVGVVRDFGGAYTGKVISSSGMHWFSTYPSEYVDKVDVRNNKTSVKVNVMKDKQYNVSAKLEVVYNLEPDKLVKLLSQNPNYKSTVISSEVKNVITANDSLANKQYLSDAEKQDITKRLDKYGIKVTNIYMDSYKLTNANNFALNTQMNK